LSRHCNRIRVRAAIYCVIHYHHSASILGQSLKSDNMFWSKGSNKKPEDKASEASPAPNATTNADPRKDATQFDPDKLPPRRELPKSLQKIVDDSDKNESFYDELVDG